MPFLPATTDRQTHSAKERAQEKRNSFKENANYQKLLRYFPFLTCFPLRLAHTGIFKLSVALALEPLFLHVSLLDGNCC